MSNFISGFKNLYTEGKNIYNNLLNPNHTDKEENCKRMAAILRTGSKVTGVAAILFLTTAALTLPAGGFFVPVLIGAPSLTLGILAGVVTYDAHTANGNVERISQLSTIPNDSKELVDLASQGTLLFRCFYDMGIILEAR